MDKSKFITNSNNKRRKPNNHKVKGGSRTSMVSSLNESNNRKKKKLSNDNKKKRNNKHNNNKGHQYTNSEPVSIENSDGAIIAHYSGTSKYRNGVLNHKLQNHKQREQSQKIMLNGLAVLSMNNDTNNTQQHTSPVPIPIHRNNCNTNGYNKYFKQNNKYTSGRKSPIPNTKQKQYPRSVPLKTIITVNHHNDNINSNGSSPYNGMDSDDISLDLDEGYDLNSNHKKQMYRNPGFSDAETYDIDLMSGTLSSPDGSSPLATKSSHTAVTDSHYYDAEEDEKYSHVYGPRTSQSDVMFDSNEFGNIDTHNTHQMRSHNDHLGNGVYDLFNSSNETSARNSIIPELPDQEMNASPFGSEASGYSPYNEPNTPSELITDDDDDCDDGGGGRVMDALGADLPGMDNSPSGHDHLWTFSDAGYTKQSGNDGDGELDDAEVDIDGNGMSITATLFLGGDMNNDNCSLGTDAMMDVFVDDYSVVSSFTEYIGCWKVIFDNKSKRNKSKRSTKFRRNKKKTVIYNILRNGTVLVDPIHSFGWNGQASIVFDEIAEKYEVTCNDFGQCDEYSHICMNHNGTLHVDHFNIRLDSLLPVVGVGIKQY